MSTEIKGAYQRGRTMMIEPAAADGGTWVEVYGEGIAVPTDDLLVAIAAECGVTVLNLAGYGVAEMSDGTIKAGRALAEPNLTAADLDDLGRCYLALARYRRENPTVDAVQVKAMASSLAEWGARTLAGSPIEIVARDLVAAGWINPTAEVTA